MPLLRPIAILALGLLASTPAFCADGKVIDLWPEGVPGQKPTDPPDLVRQDHLYHVHTPTLTVFPAPAGKACGTAVIVCPGGGYIRLPAGHSDDEETRWLNSLGITAFILTYRLGDAGVPAPLQDVARAIRIVRSRASEFEVNPDRIGLFGGSAGGHVAAWASTDYDSPWANTGAPLDAVSARPDFVIMLFPVITMLPPYASGGSTRALLGPNPTDEARRAASPELHVTAGTPPAFIVATEQDHTVPMMNAILYYEGLIKARVPGELHLYEKGPHGFGFQKNLGTTSLWPQRAEEWLRAGGWIK
jgi:acetyl esterase/lipase